LDDYLEKLWVFVIESPQPREIEPYIDVITSVDWEEEISFSIYFILFVLFYIFNLIVIAVFDTLQSEEESL